VRGWKCAPAPCSSVLLLTLCLAPTRGRSVVVAQLGLLHLLCRQLDDVAIAPAGAGPVQALRGHGDGDGGGVGGGAVEEIACRGGMEEYGLQLYFRDRSWCLGVWSSRGRKFELPPSASMSLCRHCSLHLIGWTSTSPQRPCGCVVRIRGLLSSPNQHLGPCVRTAGCAETRGAEDAIGPWAQSGWVVLRMRLDGGGSATKAAASPNCAPSQPARVVEHFIR
jgi:hypothetical protein